MSITGKQTWARWVACAVGTLCVLMGMVGCAKKPLVEDYSAYKGKTSAQIFTQGQQQLAKGQYRAAVSSFEALDALYPFGPQSRQGKLDLIYAYYMNGEMTSCQAMADRYIRLYPQGPSTDYAYYMRGVASLQQQGSWLQKRIGTDPSGRDPSYFQSAYADFAQIIQLFPRSRYAPSARWYMASIRNALAEHDLNIARFYYNRHAYVASANRASSVIVHFEGSPQVIPALWMLADSYEALKLMPEANKAIRVLRTSYGSYPNVQKRLARWDQRHNVTP